MTSIFENTKSKVTVHILHDDTLTEDNRQKFIRTAEKYSQGLELHDVTSYRQHIGKDIADLFIKSYTVGALYRLALQDILTLDKIIYLDCDILVNMDIRELWEIDTDGKYLAGVLDEFVSKQKKFSYEWIKCRINGCKIASYINSGVLVLNLKEIRKRGDFFADSVKWLKSYIYSAAYADQEVYNSLFCGSIKIIDKKFNRHKDFDGEDLSGMIIHNIWTKPWKILSDSENCTMYWEMFSKSAWGEHITPGELARILAVIHYSSPNFHKSSSRCIKSVARAVMHKLKFYKFKRLAKMILMHIYYRLTHR